MRVLQVMSSDDRRGAETFARQLGVALRGLGLQVDDVALAASGAAEPQPFTVLGPGRRDPRTWAALARAVRGHDVVVAHGGTTLQPVAAVALATGRPFVYRNIGDPEFWGRNRGAGIRVGLPLRMAAAVMALYPTAAGYLRRRYRLRPDRVVVTANAVDTTVFRRRTEADRTAGRTQLGLDDSDTVVGYLGALSPEKDPLAAVDAVRDTPGVHLVVAGAGPLEGDLRRHAERCRTRLTLLGQVTDPRSFLDALDVLVIPSRTEGVPGTLLEAAAVGVPVAATDVGGVGDVVRDLGAGIVVPAGDSTALSGATARLLADPSLGLAEATAVVERHDVDAIARQWADVLRSVSR